MTQYDITLVHNVGVELIEVAASDNMVAMAAWVSNDADSQSRLGDRDKVKGLINFLYKNKHMSPFEHGHFTFKIDAPLFVAREFFRHRTASYNEVSGRYTEMKPRFYAGEVARVQEGKMGNYFFKPGSPEQTAIYLKSKEASLTHAWHAYQQRLEAGIAKEQAREELPLSLMTQWYVTMNPRNLMQFLALRDDTHALKEIRDVARQMSEIFQQHMPLTQMAFESGRREERMRESNADYYASYKDNVQTWIDNKSKENAELRQHNEELSKRLAELEELTKTPSAQDKFDEVKARVEEKLAAARGTDTAKDDVEALEHDYVREVFNIVAPAVSKVAQAVAPVYNVYVAASEGSSSPADIAERVMAIIKKQEARRPTRRTE